MSNERARALLERQFRMPTDMVAVETVDGLDIVVLDLDKDGSYYFDAGQARGLAKAFEWASEEAARRNMERAPRPHA